jgi:dTDP-4-dehydrorhamnose 3,5-epimerase
MKWDISKSQVFEEVITFTPSIHYDVRGEIFSTFNSEIFNTYVDSPFVEDKISVSRKNVLRGLHGDTVTDKLVQCLHGELYLVVVDWREDSPTYKKWDSFILNDRNRREVLIPKGFLNGHLCLSDKCVFAYKQSSYYKGANKQVSISWNDPELDIFWPIEVPILSERDYHAK